MWEYASFPGGSILPGNPDFISPGLAIRDGDWKLLINADSTDAQLYNLAADPGETTNLVERENGLAGDLASKVIYWRRHL
jgi:arylsulfatase A-like enzyme